MSTRTLLEQPEPRPETDGGDDDRVQRGRGLSPSRASDFLQCPLLYRFRVVDRLPEPPSAAAARGTLVHAVLERLFDLPAEQRTVDSAVQLLEAEWGRLRDEDPELDGLFPPDSGSLAEWLASGQALVERYFTLENPARLEPEARELYVETELEGGLRLRGFVDRLDVAPDGALRIVDYKSSRAPSVLFEGKALFQMKFYALVLWRTRGVVPAMLQLIYLGSGEVLRYRPDEHDLHVTERKIQAIWTAIERAGQTGDWRPSRSRLCDWCHHRPLCPGWGGTPPPLPDGGTAAAASGAGSLELPGRDEEE